MTEFFIRKITRPQKLELLPSQQGVGIIVLNQLDQILLGKQGFKKDKLRPEAGLWNIFTETWQTPFPISTFQVKTNFWRAIDEELQRPKEEFIVIPGTYYETNGYYIKMLGYPFFMRLIAMRWKGNPNIDPNAVFSSHDNEINKYSYFSRKELSGLKIEHGALQALEFYQYILLPSRSQVFP
ncbi:hypothetical protein A2W14_00835 [Candidatus Gottesmanbacteria bacterium RBG_16_37_8]|uniref:Nudix hydrolase domain-containing protein n=1 Tax=Candidatus Gottesmanbacteria bacterium RBG_16_37_8 TaxID=1798371 RepID=A0A1F5YV97_9BACT|nr:MAG: hypothetical protein A2W14_00835 [Candidatus Gottesmanbacteria bacterium RBG_16_37_8]